MSELNLTPQEYRAFAHFLEQKIGIVLGDNKQYLVRSRLAPIVERHQLGSIAQLVAKVTSGLASTLHTEVLEAMTTNETFWFRDSYPFEIYKSLLPELAEKSRGRIRIWSAACSSGQEPYSLAMSTMEYSRSNPLANLPKVEIMATDLDTSIIKQAQEGCYDALSMRRGLTPERTKQFFTAQADGRYRLNDEVRPFVSFRRLNLFDSYMTLGKFDMIFCRNVLIYFSAESKAAIQRQFAAALNPGGYLILGASESLSVDVTEFEMVRIGTGTIYRKR